MLVLTDYNKNANKLVDLLLPESEAIIILSRINEVNFSFDDGKGSDRIKLIVDYLKSKPELAEAILKKLGFNSFTIEQYSTLYE